jgi:hypothetical protein
VVSTIAFEGWAATVVAYEFFCGFINFFSSHSWPQEAAYMSQGL